MGEIQNGEESQNTTQLNVQSSIKSKDPEADEEAKPVPQVSAFEQLSHELNTDQRYMKEITLGKRIGFYRIRGELGSGNFSQVKMGIHALTKEKVAIKILDKTKLDQKTQRLLSREISSMEQLHHPNIIRLYEVVETLAKLHIVMEYASGGELFTKISNEGRLPEAEAKPLFAQVVSAVQHMHTLNIIHRDLKAENVFFAAPKLVKVGDFGFSTYSKHDQTLNTFCGSPPYAAPELFKDESYFGMFVDLWALGIMLYFMLTGIMPFRAETVSKLKKCILDGSYSIPSYVTDSGQFLIRSILKHVPHDRFTIPEIKRCDWLEGCIFPKPFEPYNLHPTTSSSTVISEDEHTARTILKDIGITDAQVKSANHRDSRSSITGTYRIVLHRVQKKNLGFDDYPVEQQENMLSMVSKQSHTVLQKNIASRTCVIL
ncbi:serine/threonine-protein kinase NIM1-like [Gigantopelta aegis]|uniref:serine/threonine-protein kinase NIM1-like n=1 Tax=Gigantopelta aegis TaxID=1735272 RepID=UPI001B88E335|nr:serine/threonine-protein kinase NIM1-like [Gigantopelta aegis]